jgi:pentatricopeptide repeat protein
MNNQEQAGALLADAMSTAQMPVLPAATPGTPAPAPAPGTFPTQQARNEAVIKKLREIVTKYSSAPAGQAARGELASLLLSIGKTEEAGQHFQALSDERGIYGQTARLGLAEVQVRAGKYDEAIAIYRDMVTRKEEGLPTDGLLMQLARAYDLAGKRTEARQTYQRVVSEFPESIYTADARQQVEQLGRTTAS